MKGSLRKRKAAWFKSQSKPGLEGFIAICTAHARWSLRMPGFQRLFIMPPEHGQDPLLEWKKFERRITQLLGRVPGSWRTKRLTKKRIRALWSIHSH